MSRCLTAKKKKKSYFWALTVALELMPCAQDPKVHFSHSRLSQKPGRSIKCVDGRCANQVRLLILTMFLEQNLALIWVLPIEQLYKESTHSVFRTETSVCQVSTGIMIQIIRTGWNPGLKPRCYRRGSVNVKPYTQFNNNFTSLTWQRFVWSDDHFRPNSGYHVASLMKGCKNPI